MNNVRIDFYIIRLVFLFHIYLFLSSGTLVTKLVGACDIKAAEIDKILRVNWLGFLQTHDDLTVLEIRLFSIFLF